MKDSPVVDESNLITPSNSKENSSKPENLTDILKSIRSKNSESKSDLDEQIEYAVHNYFMQECRDSENPLEYWESASKTNSPIHKKLSELAIHYLTPPASSVDVERLFSVAGDILTNDRNRLDPERAEKILFCHQNLPLINYIY